MSYGKNESPHLIRRGDNVTGWQIGYAPFLARVGKLGSIPAPVLGAALFTATGPPRLYTTIKESKQDSFNAKLYLAARESKPRAPR